MNRQALLVCAALAAFAIPSSRALASLTPQSQAHHGETRTSSSAVIKVAFNRKLGAKIVVDGYGRTLYMLNADSSGKPTCAQLDPVCPKVWPALISQGPPKAGLGINVALLGVVKGAGGAPQVAYNKHPLYYFAGGHGTGAGDKKPGDAKGQNFEYAWFVLTPKGNPIR